MTEDMLLILAMSTDAFFAALSYSAGKIRIPAVSALIICAVSTIVLTLSAGLSSVLGSFIPDEASGKGETFVLLFRHRFCYKRLP